MMKTILLLLCMVSFFGADSARAFTPDLAWKQDKAMVERIQHDAFRLIWEDGDPTSGMVFETSQQWDDFQPLAVGGTGFGVAAIITGAERGWISREQAVERLLKMTLFLRDKTQRTEYHGAFPHWVEQETGRSLNFGGDDSGGDLVETSFLMMGLLMARDYFNGPGNEAELRSIITTLWEEVDWNWYTNGEENGLYWHWTPQRGFSHSFKILGFNECMVTYILAMASPTHPISPKAYAFWHSSEAYQPKNAFGYRVEAAFPHAGPLFLAHYSYMGLNPRLMADALVPRGYFVRNTTHALINRAWCLQEAPAENQYSPSFWGLTACQIPTGYQANEPYRDSATVAPTAAIASMPYVPHYAMQVLEYFYKNQQHMWGKNGPYDALNLRDNWHSEYWLAIDQLPITVMLENYRSGLLWKLFMADADVKRGLQRAGITEPKLAPGFPEAVVTLKKTGQGYAPDAYDTRRHPDKGLYLVPYVSRGGKEVTFELKNSAEKTAWQGKANALAGRNVLELPQLAPAGTLFTLCMSDSDGAEYSLPLRMN